MPRKQTSSRERILEAAVGLFYANGYSATGVAEILKKAEVNSGSFYFFFKSKEELLLAVLDWYLENLDPILIRPVYEATSIPIERVFAPVDDYRQKILITGVRFHLPDWSAGFWRLTPRAGMCHSKIAANFRGWTGRYNAVLMTQASRLPPRHRHTTRWRSLC